METKEINSSLIFESDGSILPENLVGLPEELVARVTTPEFKAQAAREIAAAKRREQFAQDARAIRARAQREHEQRRPSGVSGRQRKKLRKVSRVAAVLLSSARSAANAERQFPDHEPRAVD